MSRFSLVLLALVLVANVGCGDSDSSNNDSTNVTTNNSTSANNGSSANTGTNNEFTFCEDNDGATWEDRYQLRFDSIAFDKATPGAGLNGILEEGIENQADQEFPIVVLIDIRDLDPDAGTLELRGGAGIKTDTPEEYEWEPEADDTYFDGTFDPDCGALKATVDLFEFVATFETESGPTKVILPIHELEIDAAISLDGGVPSVRVVEDQRRGRLEGFITKAEADETRVTITPGSDGIPLTTVLGANQLDYDTTTGEIVPDGEGDAWRLYATFSATQTTIVD